MKYKVYGDDQPRTDVFLKLLQSDEGVDLVEVDKDGNVVWYIVRITDEGYLDLYGGVGVAGLKTDQAARIKVRKTR